MSATRTKYKQKTKKPIEGGINMIIGIPKEIKPQENRVGMTPAGIHALAAAGHTCYVEASAGLGSSFTDEEYEKAGATILGTAAEVYAVSDFIIKVKEPLPSEYSMLKPGQIMFTYLHLAPEPGLTRALMDSEIIGIVDSDPAKTGSSVLGVPVLGGDEALSAYNADSIEIVNAVGSVTLPVARKAVFTAFKMRGYSFATVIHPTAIISPYAELAEGVQVMAGAVIQPGCHIGCNTIINTRVSIDHDCTIGDHVHIAPSIVQRFAPLMPSRWTAAGARVTWGFWPKFTPGVLLHRGTQPSMGGRQAPLSDCHNPRFAPGRGCATSVLFH